MSVTKRGHSKFWYIQFQFRGQTYIRSAKTTDKRVAEQMEREWKRQLHAQAFLGQKERLTLAEALGMFCESREGTPNHKALRSNAKAVNRLLNTGRFLDELTAEDLERLKLARLREGVGPTTLKHTFGLIRGACHYARRLGYAVTPLDFPEVKLPKHRLRYLSQDEEKRLLRELNPHRSGPKMPPFAERPLEIQRQQQDCYDLVVMLLDTGARYSEIAGLEWRQVNLQDRSLHLWRPKVQNESLLYLTDRVHRILTRRRRQGGTEDYVFLNKQGGQRNYASIAIRKAFRRAGLHDCCIHTLRHTHASRLIQNGMSLPEVKEILGHADLKTTLRYAHLEQRQVSSKARDIINQLNQAIEKPELKVV